MMRRIKRPGDGISDVDLRALQDAVAMSRASGQVRSGQLNSLFGQREWFAVATLAVHDCQVRSLALRPWQTAPMHVADPDNPKPGDEEAAELLRRLLAAGLSRFEPSPIEALAAAEARAGSPLARFSEEAATPALRGKSRGRPPEAA
jgi:hypothetical protein